MGTNREENHSPAVVAKIEEEKSSALSSIAGEANDLDAVRRSVEDAAAVSGGLWLSYLFVLFYIAIAAGAVTHADLLLENPVKLPFLNVELPLKAFFFISPLLFLITYAYTLAHLVLLADRAKRFHLLLDEQIKTQGDEAGSVKNEEAARIRNGLQRQLPSNILVQFLAGPDDIRTGWFGMLLKTIAWTSLVIGPVLLLLLLQIQFLPYHHGTITWMHRLALLVALLLVWWLWRKILTGWGDFHEWASWATLATGIASSCAILSFSWTVATYPGEWQENHLPSVRVIPTRWFWDTELSKDSPSTNSVSLHEWFFAGEVDDITRRRKSLFSNTLVLPGLDVYEALKIDDPTKDKRKTHSIDLRGRHLEQSIFDLANLPNVDLSGAYLEGASLVGTQFRGAFLNGARLQGATLFWTGFQGASLPRAQLQGNHLLFTQLQGASLQEAHLQGATLIGVQLMGALLNRAQLQGASFDVVNLSGASLSSAQLQGTYFGNSQVWGVSLESAQLQGAGLLSGLAGTDLRKAVMWRTYSSAAIGGLLTSELTWGPQFLDENDQLVFWTQEKYQDMRKLVERNVPVGDDRIKAVRRIEILDCEKKRFSPPDLEIGEDSLRPLEQTTLSAKISDDLAPCDPGAKPPASTAEWQRALEKANLNEKDYIKYLATLLGDLVCEGREIVNMVALESAAMSRLESKRASRFTAGGLPTPWAHAEIGSIHILRGLFKNGRFEATRTEAPALAARILNKDCPVSAELTEDDRVRLRAFQKLNQEGAEK
jgi:uncharacterized protein YjbI with pentapeptide repeats